MCTALAEDQSLFLSTHHRLLTTACSLQQEICYPPLASMDTHMQIHIIKNKIHRELEKKIFNERKEKNLMSTNKITI